MFQSIIKIKKIHFSSSKFVSRYLLFSIVILLFLNIVILMRIRSAHFKKQFDLNKAELVGKGTFAEVFRIFDTELNDSLAIRKVKKSQGDLEDIAKEKLINEELRKVDNQNILKIYDIIDQPDVVWYITEYCSGGSLWDALNLCKDNKMSEKQSLECILQVSKGVQELHNHRITHRDLKPENILLKTKYVAGKPLPLIKLADFGLSTQKIIMETIAGTKEYIAPEQAKFHNYTNAVDVWSLGIIFDQILHGTPFYSGQDNKEVFNKILKTPFKVRNEDLRPSIKELLSSLLKKKPYERPIIAVIRSTIQKILEQIDGGQSHRKQSIQLPATDASKSSQSKITINNDSKIKIITTPVKDNMVFSKKTYEMNSKQKVEKPMVGKDVSPVSKEVNMFKKGPSTDKKQEQYVMVKPLSPQNATKDAKQPIKNLLQLPQAKIQGKRSGIEAGDTDRSKIERKPLLKLESTAKNVANQPQISNITDKISLFKNEKRKLIGSNIKREEFRSQIISTSAYSIRMVNQRNSLLNTQLKIENQHAFIPNTYLTGADFEKCPNTDIPLKEFRLKMNFLNCFNLSEDYEVRMGIAERQMQQRRNKAESELFKIQQTVKQTFFKQLDAFIDQYIDKVLK